MKPQNWELNQDLGSSLILSVRVKNNYCLYILVILTTTWVTSYVSSSRGDRWGSSEDFAVIFLHPCQSSKTITVFASPIPVHLRHVVLPTTPTTLEMYKCETDICSEDSCPANNISSDKELTEGYHWGFGS